MTPSPAARAEALEPRYTFVPEKREERDGRIATIVPGIARDGKIILRLHRVRDPSGPSITSMSTTKRERDRLAKKIVAALNAQLALDAQARLIEEARKVVDDLLPYARATVGSPRCSWPADSVILAAERFLTTLPAKGGTT